MFEVVGETDSGKPSREVADRYLWSVLTGTMPVEVTY